MSRDDLLCGVGSVPAFDCVTKFGNCDLDTFGILVTFSQNMCLSLPCGCATEAYGYMKVIMDA